ncbi:MAG: lactonase family protein [Bacteroidetes bacterium]|nr:lactonase family protein [Bacteroidota bacterium]
MKLTKQLFFFVTLLLFCLNLQAQKCYVFVGSYNDDKNKEGIYIYELDTLSGVLHKLSSVKNILNPSFLTLSTDGKRLYACTETKTVNAGSISCFAFNPQNQTLSFINTQKSGGDNPVYVSIHKSEKWIANANYSGGSVTVYPLAKDGSIEPAKQVITYSDSSVNKARQDHSHIHSSVFSPDNNYLFLPDLGADKIRIYQFDSSKDQPLQLAKIPFVKTAAGSGPRHFTFHPNGMFAYCIEEMAGTISVYKYKKGRLDHIQDIVTHSDQYKDNFGSADIHISPDGKFLYASNRGGENNIAIFSIQKDGKLKTIGYQSTLGNHPRNFALDPTGKFLIVANMNSGDIVVFKRNSITGLLTKVGTDIKVPTSPSCIKIRQY